MVLSYADLVTDILVVIELMTINVPIAVLNLFFILLGIVLGYWNSERTMNRIGIGRKTGRSCSVDAFSHSPTFFIFERFG